MQLSEGYGMVLLGMGLVFDVVHRCCVGTRCWKQCLTPVMILVENRH